MKKKLPRRQSLALLTKQPFLRSPGKSRQRLLKISAQIRRWQIVHRQPLFPRFLISICLRTRADIFTKKRPELTQRNPVR
jgi:hypothetical protein